MFVMQSEDIYINTYILIDTHTSGNIRLKIHLGVVWDR